MKIIIRPHHLLCLQGYKGYNYNRSQKHSWKMISNLLQSSPDTDVYIAKSSDDLCANCPTKIIPLKSHCIEQNVSQLDKKVKILIGIEEGKTYKYQDILKNLRKIMTPEKHRELCSECAWWQKGLCRDSFEE